MYPILFEFGPITVFSRWLFIALGFAAGALFFSRLAKRSRTKLDLISGNSLLLFFLTLGLARIFFIVTHPDIYFAHFSFGKFLSFFAIWDKGLSFWGAVAGWFGGVFWVSREKESPLRLFDLMMPAVFLGMMFGHLGAFLDGANYGTPTSLPWGVTFLNANVKYITPIHPTQLYAFIYTLGLTVLLFRLLERLRDHSPGLVTKVAVLAFSFFRFLEEFFRGDETLEIFNLRIPQIMAFVGIAASVYLIYKSKTKSA